MSNKTSDKNVEIVKELIQEYKTYSDLDGIQDLSIYVNALEELLAELEQKDKRIQELEEENAEIKNTKMNEYLHKNLWLAKYLDELYMPKQVVIDKMEDLKRQRRKLGFKTYLKRKDMLNDDRIIVCEIQVLQELLETK